MWIRFTYTYTQSHTHLEHSIYMSVSASFPFTCISPFSLPFSSSLSLFLSYSSPPPQLSDSLPDIMSQLTQAHNIPLVQQMRLMTRLRLAKNFNSLQHRIRCVLVRLQAISVLGKYMYM